MTTKEIYDLAVQKGIKADFRSPATIKKYLERVKTKYEKLEKQEKEYFDKDKLFNPYSDTRLLVDNKKKAIKKIVASIDSDVGEIMLAKELGADLYINHHPAGRALNDLHNVMDMQVEMYERIGVPINVAEFMIKPRKAELNRRWMPMNTTKAIDAARLFKMDFMCTHTVCDNMSADFVEKTIAKKKPEYVEEVLKILENIPEYIEAKKINDGPEIVAGEKDNHCGKVVVSEFTGGTSFTKEIYEKMSQAGVGTIISMHMKDDYLEEAKKQHINVIIAGHMASDSLGMNLFLDEIENKGIEVIPCSGLIRVNRK
jgi:putative NIF3 family GTP cyclohydrolase 1 type 2